MSLRISTFRPTASGIFSNTSESNRDQLSLRFPVSTETPHGYYLGVKVPGVGYFLAKNRYEETKREWRAA